MTDDAPTTRILCTTEMADPVEHWISTTRTIFTILHHHLDMRKIRWVSSVSAVNKITKRLKS